MGTRFKTPLGWVAPNRAPRLARSRPPWPLLFGEHQLGLFGDRTRTIRVVKPLN
jgi:hypothetical protein